MLGWVEAHAGLANWLQAIGTLVALFIAIALPIIERRHVHASAAIALRPILHAILEELYDIAVYKDKADPTTRARLLTRVSDSYSSLREAPINLLDPRAALPPHQLISLVRWLRDRLTVTRDTNEDIGLEQIGFSAIDSLRRAQAFAPQLVDNDYLESVAQSLAARGALVD